MSVKQLTRIALLAALCMALRHLFGPLPNIKPLTAIFLVSVIYLGWLEAFLIMAVTMVGTGLILGGGLVILWQVLSYGVILFLWQVLVAWWARSYPKTWPLQAALSGLAGFGFGFFISMPLAFLYETDFWVYWLQGLPFDQAHAYSTALFYPIIYFMYRRFLHHENHEKTTLAP